MEVAAFYDLHQYPSEEGFWGLEHVDGSCSAPEPEIEQC